MRITDIGDMLNSGPTGEGFYAEFEATTDDGKVVTLLIEHAYDDSGRLIRERAAADYGEHTLNAPAEGPLVEALCTELREEYDAQGPR